MKLLEYTMINLRVLQYIKLATSYHLMQVLAGPSVVVCPAGELAHQLRRGHRCSQRRGGHAITKRFQRVIHPFHRAGEGQMPLMRHADTVRRQEIVGQVAVASTQEDGE